MSTRVIPQRDNGGRERAGLYVPHKISTGGNPTIEEMNTKPGVMPNGYGGLIVEWCEPKHKELGMPEIWAVVFLMYALTAWGVIIRKNK